MITKPLWEGFSRNGKVVTVVALLPIENYPIVVVQQTETTRFDIYRVSLRGRYSGWGNETDAKDVMKLPKDFKSYLDNKVSNEKIEADEIARKDAIMECNKLVLVLALDGNLQQSKGAQKCVNRLTALLNGKKAPKIVKPKKAAMIGK